MTDVTTADLEAEEAAPGCLWWGVLLAGVAWVLIAFAILGADPTSAAIIGKMIGVVILLAGFTEFASIAVTDGWKWARAGLGIIFIITASWRCLTRFRRSGSWRCSSAGNSSCGAPSALS